MDAVLAQADTCLSDGTTGRAKVTPLGGTRMRIPVAARKLPRSGVLRRLIQLSVRNVYVHIHPFVHRTGQQVKLQYGGASTTGIGVYKMSGSRLRIKSALAASISSLLRGLSEFFKILEG